MTNEEAIESFKHSNKQAKVRLEVEKMRMDSGEIKELEFYIERDEMAIKALETITKYKDAYNKGWDDGAKASYEHLKMCEEEKEPKWIPVSEREPEDMCYVWLTCISKVDDREPWVCDGFYNPYYTGDKYSKWGNIPMLNWGDAEVIAWMEQDIPEPYKDGGDNE